MGERRPLQPDGITTQAKLLDNDGFPAALCDPPDDCSTCFLFGNADDPAWRERVRSAFQSAPEYQGHRPFRSRGLTPADRRLLAALGDDYRNGSQIAAQLGVRVLSVGKMVADARRRGAQIESRKMGGYRLRSEQSA